MATLQDIQNEITELKNIILLKSKQASNVTDEDLDDLVSQLQDIKFSATLIADPAELAQEQLNLSK